MWKYLVFWIVLVNGNSTIVKTPLIIDFRENKDFDNWIVINDGVMGGLSQSQARLDGDVVLFSGTLSLKNNGGFVSLRSTLGNYDLSEFTHCEIRFKSDTDRKFELLIEKDTPFYLPKFRVTFAASTRDWETVTIALAEMEINRMGQTMQRGIEPRLLHGIQRIGFILADKQEGGVRLWIDYVKFY